MPRVKSRAAVEALAGVVFEGVDVAEARADLGVRWGLGRPLFASELGRLLRVGGKNPSERVRDWERGVHEVPGSVQLALELMLDGAMPRSLQGLSSEP